MISQSIVGDRREGRPKDDFYPTPENATLALLSVENFYGSIWEPACGDGAISKVLEAKGYKTYSTDLIDRGYGKGGVDFLFQYELIANNIITNPPFCLCNEFIERAACLSPRKFAFLLKLSALEGVTRSRLMERTKLTRIHVFRNRLTMTRNGEASRNGGMIAFAWFVWDVDHFGEKTAPTIGWIDANR